MRVEPQLELNLQGLGEGVTFDLKEWVLLSIEDGATLEIERGMGALPQQVTWSPIEPLSADRQRGLKLRVEGELTYPGRLTRPTGLIGRVQVESAPLWLKGRDSRAIKVDPTSPPTWSLRLNKETLSGLSLIHI